MKKIIAAITMACLALCYYNVEAARGGYNKGKQAARQAKKRDKNKEVMNELREKRTYVESETQTEDESKDAETQTEDDSEENVKLSDESKAKYKKAAGEWVRRRIEKTKDEDDASESESDEENDAEEQPRKQLPSKKSAFSDEDSKVLKKQIEEISGVQIQFTPKSAKEAISWVSKILKIPEEFLVIPKFTFKEKGEDMNKVHFVNPYKNGLLFSRELKIVFQGYENKLKEYELLPIYIAPLTVNGEMINKDVRQSFQTVAAKIWDARKGKQRNKPEYFYTDMPDEDEIKEAVNEIQESVE